ncbi:hypothetical protein DICPUDRAFT_11664, partial [Dictyostelium purpureum]
MAEVDEFSAYRSENVVSTEQRILYFIMGSLVSLVPVYLYHAIFYLSFEENMIVYGSVTLFSAIVLTFAYNNIYRMKKLKLSSAREHNVPKTGKVSGDKKKVAAAQKELQSVHTSNEAIAASVMYNNAVFLISFLVFSFIIFKNVGLVYNYITSVSLASGLTTFLSTGS